MGEIVVVGLLKVWYRGVLVYGELEYVGFGVVGDSFVYLGILCL